jgi:hypothetical protein
MRNKRPFRPRRPFTPGPLAINQAATGDGARAGLIGSFTSRRLNVLMKNVVNHGLSGVEESSAGIPFAHIVGYSDVYGLRWCNWHMNRRGLNNYGHVLRFFLDIAVLLRLLSLSRGSRSS